MQGFWIFKHAKTKRLQDSNSVSSSDDLKISKIDDPVIIAEAAYAQDVSKLKSLLPHAAAHVSGVLQSDGAANNVQNWFDQSNQELPPPGGGDGDIRGTEEEASSA